MQKKQEMHRTHKRADTDRVWTEIEHCNGYYQSQYQKTIDRAGE